MKRFYDVLSVLCMTAILAMLPVSAICAQNTELPYECTFETAADTAGWIFVKRGTMSPSEWSWGASERRAGEKAIYISSDGGATAGYEEYTSGYHVAAYRKFTLAAGTYDLAFDCLVGGETAAYGAADDGMKVVWMPVSSGTPTAGFGPKFPNYALFNEVTLAGGSSELSNVGWENMTATVSVTAPNTEYYLAFVWKTNGKNVNNPGACIDNVQLAPQYKGECAERPSNITVSMTASAGGCVVSWTGAADEYDIKYYLTKPLPGQNKQEYIVRGHKSTTYTVQSNTIDEGIYTVLVRSVCGGDTSIWSKVEEVFIYDASSHCLDYLNFDAEGVECTYGNFENPRAIPKAKNFGYESKYSVHTIHYKGDEYDPRTLNRLKTVPPGAAASVRISNWTEYESESGTITYTYTVTEDADVLTLRYAAVLQYEAGHEDFEQTRIIVEILDATTDTLVSQCTYSNFNAKSVNNDNVRGWNRIEPFEFPYGLLDLQVPIWWCDWTTIGINLSPYVGRTFKIRLTLLACYYDYHFAYAYFTLDCDKGEIDGVSCGEHPDTLRVPEGFWYEWYKTHDEERKVVGTDDFLEIQPEDTSSYSVDLIFPDNDNCYFTLKASALPKEPIAKASYTIGYEECQSVVKLKNETKVYGFWKGDTIDTQDECRAFEWDFGKYGTSNEFTPEIHVPAEGDTFKITLSASIDSDWRCADTKEFTVEVPSIVQKGETVVRYGICNEASVVHDGVEYTEAGRTELHYSSSVTGCDSVVILEITKVVTDTVIESATVCTADLPVMFHGKELTETGVYEHVDKSVAGCDSMVYVLDLTVNESLVAELPSGEVEVCADYGTFSVPFTVRDGEATDYRVVYGDDAYGNAFPDTEKLPVTDEGEVSVGLPAGVRPGDYDAELVLYSGECDSVSLPLTIKVFYPSSILVQRWNDVLALKNKDFNGGYEFSSYQWYKGGGELQGEVMPILYLPDEMDFSAEYRMLLTRADDGVSTFTCPIVPQRYADADIEVFPTVVFPGGQVKVLSKQRATAKLYSVSGQTVYTFDVSPGENALRMPVADGIYILSVMYGEVVAENIKIVVGK